jgi:hypothetical protein
MTRKSMDLKRNQQELFNMKREQWRKKVESFQGPQSNIKTLSCDIGIGEDEE